MAMAGNWGKIGVMSLLLAFAIGCRTPQPNLKPVKEAEGLNPPPSEARYNQPGYPKEAFKTEDPTKARFDPSGNVIPARGGMAGPGGMGMSGRGY